MNLSSRPNVLSVPLTWVAMLALLTIWVACGSNNINNLNELDSPTRGHIKISVDANYQPIIDSELMVFHSLYENAHITPRYTSESEAIQDLLLDSARVAFVSRKLTDAELQPFKALQYSPKVIEMARDAVSLIVNPANTDTSLALSELKDILNGKIKSWKELNLKSKLGVIRVVFDNPNSGIVRYVRDSVCRCEKLPETAFAAQTNEEVIKYVSENPAAIGIIGVNWISDFDDPTVQNFMKEIRTVSIASQKGGEYFKPYQAYIATKQYPLLRTLYSISREARSGLGVGITSFIASERGQRIILKSGLVPATMPLRVIKTDTEQKKW